MANNNSNRRGMSPFLAALIGAIIGGLLVYLLTTTISVNSPSETAYLDQEKRIEALEARLKTSEIEKTKSLANPSTSMESTVVKKSIESVVGITTSAEVVQETWLGPVSGYAEGIGSGSIISSDGYILTNSHVVSDGDVKEINVMFNNGEIEPAELIWNDATLDLAIVKVNRTGLPAIELGDSDVITVGERVVAIGNPLGLELQSTVTSGIISGLNRTVSFQTGAQMDGLMQTDAAINAGNSGGALLNSKGEQIGINTAKAGNSDGIGFAIPINLVKPVIEQIRETGEYHSVYLGITGQSLDFFKQFPQVNMADFEDMEGVYVQGVFDNKDVFKEGDLITSVDGKQVTDMGSLKKILLGYRLGERAKITLVRDGLEQTIDFTFTIDSSNVDEYKEAKPSNKVEREADKKRGLEQFFNLP